MTSLSRLRHRSTTSDTSTIRSGSLGTSLLSSGASIGVSPKEELGSTWSYPLSGSLTPTLSEGDVSKNGAALYLSISFEPLRSGANCEHTSANCEHKCNGSVKGILCSVSVDLL